ncbi:MAG: carboxypeptidase-like regulatory domain-containing protein [Halomonas sp.]|nr:carboxypeptidase-like regulatory domain-containing protein [Halomonas sp.]
MKHSTLFNAALISGMLAMGMVTQAGAMPHSEALKLQNGNTGSRLAFGLDHYRIQVNDPTQISISSHLWHEVSGGKVTADLRDSNGNVVAQSRSDGRNFTLKEHLQPGSYTLKVNASQRGGGKGSLQRYYLSTDMR